MPGYGLRIDCFWREKAMSDAVRAAQSMRETLMARSQQPRPLAEALAGRGPRDPALRQVTLRLHPRVHAVLAELAAAQGMSANALLHVLIDRAFIDYGLRSVLELDPAASERLR
jgi:hypothetical protein